MSNNSNLEERVLAFLRASPHSSFNFSEIGRAVGKAPPTIKRVVEKLEEKKILAISDKKSMKLVSLCK